MTVSTINRMARGMDYPSLTTSDGSVTLVTDVAAPGTAYQNKSYGLNGLGSVISDITSLNFAALPGDFITGLNPATFDIGSYLLLGLGAFLLLGSFKGGKGATRRTARKARLVGQVAQDQALLKAA